MMELGKTGLQVPPMIVGTSALGNLYESKPYGKKLELVRAALDCFPERAVFDSAGKYGAGLALETLGQALNELQVSQEKIIISNKLGWKQVPLQGKNPSFEQEIWKDLHHDAVQDISYNGILNCFEEGNTLLNGYECQLVSIHDPDEYLDQAVSPKDYEKRFADILDGYSALEVLRKTGRIKAIGVGSKDWRVIQKIYKHYQLDWVMIANSMTIYHHPEDLFNFMVELEKDGVGIINSAVFHSGFLVGGAYFDYQKMKKSDSQYSLRHQWRDKFFQLCIAQEVDPAHACIQFALQLPGVNCLALNSTSVRRTQANAAFCTKGLPDEFWNRLKEEKMIAEHLLKFNTTT